MPTPPVNWRPAAYMLGGLVGLALVAALVALAVRYGSGGSLGAPAAADALAGAPPLPVTFSVRFQGRTAGQWGRDLLDQDPWRSGQAAMALNRIGKEGVPVLLRGMRSESHFARGQSATCIDLDAAKLYEAHVLPEPVRLLADEPDQVRLQAVITLTNCRFTEAVPDLRRLRAREASAEVKTQLDRSLASLAGK